MDDILTYIFDHVTIFEYYRHCEPQQGRGNLMGEIITLKDYRVAQASSQLQKYDNHFNTRFHGVSE